MEPFNFRELDTETRGFMLAELDRDVARDGHPYIGETSLTAKGKADYETLLRRAIESGTEQDLIADLESEERATRDRPDMARRLGSSEFNKYYMRGVCLRARAHGVDTVAIYRARASKVERPDSKAAIGQVRSATRALDDLRAGVNAPKDSSYGLVYSGLSLRCGCDTCRPAADE